VLRRVGLPDVTGHVPLLTALGVDALGSGVFLPFSVLFFRATTPLSLAEVGLALSVAAGIALPAGPLLGTLVDRSGARQVLLAGNVLQALGVASYLIVDTFGSLVVAAVAVALGSQAFWAAYSPLVTQVSKPGQRERWYGLLGALRNAGFGLGGLLSGVALTTDGTAGYRSVAAVNAGSFLLAALLLLIDRSHAGPAATVSNSADSTNGAAGWRAVLADRPYLALTVVNVAFATNSFALTLVLPVYAVVRLGLPVWLPGVGLTLNCLLIALVQGPVVSALTGRARVRALQASSALSAAFAMLMLLSAAVPRAAGVAIVLAAVAVFTLGELIESPVLAAVASEAAPDALRGRYLALNQISWNVSNTVAPALLTGLLAAGTWPVWIALGALAAAAAIGISAVSTRLPAARQQIGLAPEIAPCRVTP
jgi:MFS family permease